MTKHPQTVPDLNTYLCPKCGRLRFSFSMNEVNAFRASIAAAFAEPDSGSAASQTAESTTCGTITCYATKGVNDGDGLPTIQRAEVDGSHLPDRWTRRLVWVPADHTINTSPTNVSGLTIPIRSGETLSWNAALWVKTSNAAIGAMISCNGPTAIANGLGFQTTEWTSGLLKSENTQFLFNSFSTQTAGPGATPRLFIIQGTASFSANGNFTVVAKASAGGTMTVVARSKLVGDIL